MSQQAGLTWLYPVLMHDLEEFHWLFGRDVGHQDQTLRWPASQVLFTETISKYLEVWLSWLLSVQESSERADLQPSVLPCWFLCMEYPLPLLLSEAGLELLFKADHLVSGHESKNHKQPKEQWPDRR